MFLCRLQKRPVLSLDPLCIDPAVGELQQLGDRAEKAGFYRAGRAGIHLKK
jgi:hypothetical protein